MMKERQMIVTLEDDFGRVQTSIATSLSAPQLMDKIMEIDEQQATIKSKDKQLERLYNYFQDYLKDEMSGNAFSEMWDFVKEDERWNDE